MSACSLSGSLLYAGNKAVSKRDYHPLPSQSLYSIGGRDNAPLNLPRWVLITAALKGEAREQVGRDGGYIEVGGQEKSF